MAADKRPHTIILTELMSGTNDGPSQERETGLPVAKIKKMYREQRTLWHRREARNVDVTVIELAGSDLMYVKESVRSITRMINGDNGEIEINVG